MVKVTFSDFMSEKYVDSETTGLISWNWYGWPKGKFATKLVQSLSLSQLLAIIPCDISSECSGDGVDDVDGEEEGAGAKANHQPGQAIHHKAHLGLASL